MPIPKIQPLTPELRATLMEMQVRLHGLPEHTPQFNTLLTEFTDILMTLSIDDYLKFQNRTD